MKSALISAGKFATTIHRDDSVAPRISGADYFVSFADHAGINIEFNGGRPRIRKGDLHLGSLARGQDSQFSAVGVLIFVRLEIAT